MSARAAHGPGAPGPGSRPRHVPMRRCLACRLSRPQAELVRLVLDAQGQWQLDPARKAPGRGAWVCRDNASCWSAKALKRSLRAQAERVADELARLGEGQQAAAVKRAAQEADQAAGRNPSQHPHTLEEDPKPGRVRVRAKAEPSSNPSEKTGNGGPNV